MKYYQLRKYARDTYSDELGTPQFEVIEERHTEIDFRYIKAPKDTPAHYYRWVRVNQKFSRW